MTSGPGGTGPGGTGPDAASPGAAGLLWLWAMVTGLGAGDPPASLPPRG